MLYKNITLDKDTWLEKNHEPEEITDLSVFRDYIFDGYILEPTDVFVEDIQLHITSKGFENLQEIQKYILWDLEPTQRIFLYKILKMNWDNTKDCYILYSALLNDIYNEHV
jgi:hypothetical protein